MSVKKTATNDSQEQLRQIADSLEQIRRLLIHALIRNGASQEEVATALGTTQASISRLFSSPKKTTKRRR